MMRIQEMFDKEMKRVNTFVNMDIELVKGSKTKAEGSSKRAGEELESNNSKKQKIDEHVEAEGNDDQEEAEMKKHMEIDINREDLETLWKLVKAKHGNTRPEEAYERVLWGDLKVMFEPDVESEIWRNLQGYKVTVWKLFSSCGVHFVRFQNMHIFMLVEKKYPLTPATITEMLNKKLQTDYWNEMCYQLLKLMTKQGRIIGIKSLLMLLGVNIAKQRYKLWRLQSPLQKDENAEDVIVNYVGASIDKNYTNRRLVQFLEETDFMAMQEANYANDGIQVSVVGLTYYWFLQLFLNNQIENLEAVFNDKYDTPSHTKKVFANMRRQGKAFLRTVTPLFPSMLASQAVDSEGSGQLSEPQHTPTTASPSHSSGPTTLIADETVYEERGDSVERAATTAASLDAEQDSGNIIRTQSMTTRNEPIPQGTGSGSGPKRQDTILGDMSAQTRFERLSKQSNDPSLSRVNTLGSREDSMKLNELMEIYTRLSERVLALENIKTAQNLEIINLKKRVKKLEKKKKARNPQLKRRLFKVRIESSAEKSLETQGSAPVTPNGVSVSTAKPSTPLTTTILIEDEDLTIAQTLMKMRSVKSKEKGVSSETTIRPTRGVIMKEASETITRPIVPPQQQLDTKDKGKGIMQEPEKPVKMKSKDQITFDEEVAQRLEAQMQAEYEKEERVARQREEEDNLISWDNTQAMIEADYELAQRLQAEEQGELTIEERSKLFVELMDKRKKHFVKLRAEEIRRKPPTKTQKRNQMCTYLKNIANYKHSQLKNKSFREIQILFNNTMKWVDSFVPMDSEVIEGSKSQAERSDAITIESLATKYPIVDWKTHILAEDKMYYQIIRADGSAKFYKIFSAMLDDFDRQDVLDLYRLVKERFETTSPEGYDRLLWGDLITLFEPSEEDEIWKAQQDYTLISWTLYDSCGVHLLLMDTRFTIHMMVEKKYPFTQEMLSRMLSGKLEVDHECEMAYELLRFTKSQYKK
ncbi:hypothetical protein Tco_0633005 [Tanacetum coccineum]